MKFANYKNNQIGKSTEEIVATEEEINAEFDTVRKQLTTTITKDGISENGDVVKIDYEGFLDGVPFQGGKGEKYDLELGSHTFIPGFEEQLVGHKKDEDVEVNVTFPENYQAENLKGKAVVFKCHIHDVMSKNIPEVDDAFAQRFQYPDLKTLKEDVRKEIVFRKNKQVQQAYLQKLMTKLIEESEIDVNEEQLEKVMDDMMQYYSQQLLQYGLTLDAYLQQMGQTIESFREQSKPGVIMTCKTELFYDEVAKQESIVVTDEELEQYLNNVKMNANMTDEQFASFKEQRKEDVRKQVIDEKVMDYLYRNND